MLNISDEGGRGAGGPGTPDFGWRIFSCSWDSLVYSKPIPAMQKLHYSQAFKLVTRGNVLCFQLCFQLCFSAALVKRSSAFQFQLILPAHPSGIWRLPGQDVGAQYEFTKNMFQLLYFVTSGRVDNICARIIFSSWYLGRGAAIACTITLTYFQKI